MRLEKFPNIKGQSGCVYMLTDGTHTVELFDLHEWDTETLTSMLSCAMAEQGESIQDVSEYLKEKYSFKERNGIADRVK